MCRPVTQNPKHPAGALPLTYVLSPGLHIKGFLINDWIASQEQGGGDTGGLPSQGVREGQACAHMRPLGLGGWSYGFEQ